jgi:hypothetical protein
VPGFLETGCVASEKQASDQAAYHDRSPEAKIVESTFADVKTASLQDSHCSVEPNHQHECGGPPAGDAFCARSHGWHVSKVVWLYGSYFPDGKPIFPRPQAREKERKKTVDGSTVQN